jgi:hypothetical protein
MALTVTQKGRTNVIGSRQMVTLDITFDSSYPTGGESLDLEDYVGTIDMVMCETSNEGHSIFYDRTNKKLKAFGTIDMTVVDGDTGGNANNLGTELNVTPGYGEVANATDMQTVTTTLVVYGTRA